MMSVRITQLPGKSAPDASEAKNALFSTLYKEYLKNYREAAVRPLHKHKDGTQIDETSWTGLGQSCSIEKRRQRLCMTTLHVQKRQSTSALFKIVE